MKNFDVSANWTQPYRTHTLLWQHIDNQETLAEMDSLEKQLRTTTLAQKMLKDIGVKV